MSGYNVKLLRINLSTGKVDNETIVLNDVRDFIGGRGFAIKYLYKELAPHIDPLSEENKLLLVTGVLAGTSVQGGSRWLAYCKSPLTGCVARACAGGDFAAWLKFAGYDLVIIGGKAERPVYLLVTSDGCQIEDARELWGKNTRETQEWLAQRHGSDSRVACIGTAGENLVKYAAIITGRRSASRCGVGTVMGCKNLKAVAIKAQRNLNLYDPAGLKQLVKEQISIAQASKGYKVRKEEGTTGAISRYNPMGTYPVRNFRYGQMDGYEALSPDEYKKLRVADVGCYACSVRCGKVHVIPEGRPYSGARSEGPEYESAWAFTGSIESNCIEYTVAADELCDDLGLDTITTGSSVGFAYELYEKGILTKADTDGLELTYGNHSAVITLIKKIARREGFGDVLADGTVQAARRLGKGAETYAMQSKGLEFPAYEPRGLKTLAFNFATSNIGGSHCYGYASQEIGGTVPRAVDRFAEEGKADIVIYNQDGSALRETGVICSFSAEWGDWYPRLFNKMLVATTGIEEFGDWGYLRKVGERIVNLERAFNVRDGFSRAQDTLPQRFLNEPLRTRGAQGEGQMIRELGTFLDEYYKLRGWNQDGIPSREKLQELGLDYVVKDIEQSHGAPGLK